MDNSVVHCKLHTHPTPRLSGKLDCSRLCGDVNYISMCPCEIRNFPEMFNKDIFEKK